MHRIDSEGNINNLFFDGDTTAATEIQATIIDAAWLNGLQESLCKVIESEGLTLEKGSNETLYKAINLMFERHLEPLKKEINNLKLKVGV